MAAPYTDTSALSNLVAAAYDRKVQHALRAQPLFRSLVDVAPAQPTAPGSSITLNILPDLVAVTTALGENADGNETLLSNPTQVTVTPAEYGAYTVVSNKLSLLTYDSALDSNVVTKISNQLADSVDALVKAKFDASTNDLAEEAGSLVTTVTEANIVATDVLKSRTVRYAVAKMRGANVAPHKSTLFGAFVHPDVSHDLRSESGSLGWRVPAEYASNEKIEAGEIGIYEGAFWIENPRCTITADAGAGNVDVYNTYVLGKEAAVEYVPEEFHVVVDGTISDPLNRRQAIGWYGVAGWSLYRSDALRLIKTASSIGANA